MLKVSFVYFVFRKLVLTKPSFSQAPSPLITSVRIPVYVTSRRVDILYVRCQ